MHRAAVTKEPDECPWLPPSGRAGAGGIAPPCDGGHRALKPDRPHPVSSGPLEQGPPCSEC